MNQIVSKVHLFFKVIGLVFMLSNGLLTLVENEFDIMSFTVETTLICSAAYEPGPVLSWKRVILTGWLSVCDFFELTWVLASTVRISVLHCVERGHTSQLAGLASVTLESHCTYLSRDSL